MRGVEFSRPSDGGQRVPWLLSVDYFPGDLLNGHLLHAQLEQAEEEFLDELDHDGLGQHGLVVVVAILFRILALALVRSLGRSRRSALGGRYGRLFEGALG